MSIRENPGFRLWSFPPPAEIHHVKSGSSPAPSSLPPSQPWLEAVVNLSTGRRLGEVKRVIRGLSPWLLDVHRDRDHGRSVLTFYGPQAELEAAILAASDRTLAQTDLSLHRGKHPFLGAVDLVPFVYLRPEDRSGAIAQARAFAEQFAQRYEIPVFLYGDASPSGDRSLPEIRKGGLDGLKARMQDGLEPDFGPKSPHPRWGATIVGARPLLIAFNVDFPGGELGRCRRLARRVRESNGGFPKVRALGLELPSRGITQLSMNFLDSKITAPDQVVEELRSQGEPFHRSELVGLIPEEVVLEAGRRRLGLDSSFDPATHLLEPRLRRAKVQGEWRRLSPKIPRGLRGPIQALLEEALGADLRAPRSPSTNFASAPLRSDQEISSEKE